MTANTFDAAEFRSHFPHLSEITHFASCSQGALSREQHYALADLTRSLHLKGNPWDEWMGEVESLRTEFAALINTTPEHIAIVSCASAGAYQVASAFDVQNASIVTSSLEFPSIGQVWQAQRANGATVEYIDDREAALTADSWTDHMGPSTKLVSVPLVSYHNGARPDSEQIIREARNRGITTFVDAYQGAGVLPIDVQKLDCDFLVTGTLKYLLGLAGVAFLYVRDIDHADREPEATGWFGRVNPFEFDPRDTSYPREARKYEGGTPSVPSVFASLAGIRLIGKVDQADGYAYLTDLREYLRSELSAIGISLSEPATASNRGPQVAIRLPDPDDAAGRLASQGIITSPRNDVLRLSLHYYCDTTDVDRTVAALNTLA